MTTKHEELYEKAFEDYLRTGNEDGLAELSKKVFDAVADNGHLISSHISDMIIKTVFETSPMRQIANTVVISGDALEIHSAGSAIQTIPVHELYAQPKATQKLIDDAAIDIEAWLADKISQIFSKKENAAFISGDGVGKPRGILTYASGTSWGQIEQLISGMDGKIVADKLIEFSYSLKAGYAVNASFLMNREAVDIVKKIKYNDAYLWNPGLALGAPDTLMGIPVHQSADMPVPATGSLSIALGDFKAAYQIVDRAEIRVLRDPFTDKPFVKFYTTKRVGGDVVNFDAIKLLKLSA